MMAVKKATKTKAVSPKQPKTVATETAQPEAAPAEAVQAGSTPQETVAAKASAKTAKKKASSVSKAAVKGKAATKAKAGKKPVAKAESKVGSKASSKADAKADSKTSLKAKKAPKAGVAKAKTAAKAESEKAAQILDSKVVYQGPLFRVLNDHLIEPDGTESHRDVIRHNGSVVILAVDAQGGHKHGKHRKNPWVVIERQYRHAAGQYLWELPAGKLDAGETALAGAQRELAEETGYAAKKWTPLVEYFASPGFLGESMKVFLAEGLIAGEAHPEEDEHIDFRLVKLSELLEMVDEGKILDGKTLSSVLLYARQLGLKRKH